MIYLKRSLGFFIRVFTINFIPSGQLLSFLCPFTVRFREHSPNKPLLIFLSNYFCDYRPFFSSTFAMSAEPQGGRAIAPQSIPSPCSDHAPARPSTAALVLHQRALEVAVELLVSPGHPWGTLGSAPTFFWSGQEPLVSTRCAQPEPGPAGAR